MSWCDKLASTPAVGFRFVPHFEPSDSILSALSPLLDPLADLHHQRFKIERVEPFAVQFSTDDGYTYLIDQQRMAVEFVHKMRVKPQSGGPPIAEMLSQPRPYTALLPDVAERAVEAFSLISRAKSRRLDRVGIVSTTYADIAEAPPGVARFIKYVTRPWRGVLDHCDITVTSQLDAKEDYTDRCMHTVVKPEDAEQLMTIKLDVQRVFSTPRVIAADALGKMVANVQTLALAYFEDFAEGARFDEQIINSTT